MCKLHRLLGQAKLDDSAQVFHWNYILMTILGLWPSNPSDLRFFLNFGYFCYQMVLEYLDLFLCLDNFEHVLMNLSEIMAFTPMVIVLFMLRVHNRKLGEIISDAKRDFDAKDYTQKEIKVFVSYYIKTKTFIKILLANTALTATSYYVKPLLGQTEELMQLANSNGNSTFIFTLPYHFYTFYEVKDVQTYFWTYGSHLPFVFISGIGRNAGDCLMFTMVYHISGQMAVLASRITNINTDPSKCTQEVQRIVRAHIRLLRMGNLIREAYSASLLGTLVGTTSLICILGYQILACLANGERAILISLFTFILLVLLILYIHCVVGERLIIESNRVSEAYYNCEWYKMSKENARIIILCMARSQKPLQLTAGKFTTFYLQTFTNAVKASLGYLSVLRTVM